MVKISQRSKLAPDFDLLRGTSYWTKVKYFWRKGWTEIPVIMACTPLTLIATGGFGFMVWYIKTHDMTPKYHKLPLIYRPDDPRVSRIRHESWFDK
ncbi:uncharacterized protein LOC116845666 [Odontomachus brunneus]|uniref:uncharacterized protein LOC116845666 n=1 Tax=Odontomachus brunneus TaxID=486640 RepID=UPI0013F1E2B9|nr:uncharacterized protein LOC116845666 [Odontomachus brunneus]